MMEQTAWLERAVQQTAWLERRVKALEIEWPSSAQILERQLALIELEPIDVSDLVTEDDTPVDNLFSEKQQRLLTETLYTSWKGGETGQHFLAAANVAVYYAQLKPPIVPDVFLSLDVEVAEDWYDKRHRSYFLWEFGKPPEVAIEIVSNKKGEEEERKLKLYGQIRVDYYVIFDPTRQLSDSILRVYAPGEISASPRWWA